jgi:NADH-quinone oxidoreductase subunit H
MCSFQAFVRWSLPRFRYDQLMKLGWRALLPAALANIFVTGLVWIGIDRAGVELSNALKVVGDITQAIIAFAITFGVVRVAVGMAGKREHRYSTAGTSAKLAEKLGGSKETPMQA